MLARGVAALAVEVLAVDNSDATETEMITARRPPRILDCYAGPSLLASLAVGHFADYLPYYREEERLQRLGVSIPRSTIARWMIRLAERLDPLIERLRQAALASAVASVDETSIKLLDPELAYARNAYLWAVVGDAAHPYTRGLLASVPRLDRADDTLHAIPGNPPNLLNLPRGCSFRSRCEHAFDECSLKPLLQDMGDGHLKRCRLEDAE